MTYRVNNGMVWANCQLNVCVARAPCDADLEAEWISAARQYLPLDYSVTEWAEEDTNEKNPALRTKTASRRDDLRKVSSKLQWVNEALPSTTNNKPTMPSSATVNITYVLRTPQTFKIKSLSSPVILKSALSCVKNVWRNLWRQSDAWWRWRMILRHTETMMKSHRRIVRQCSGWDSAESWNLLTQCNLCI